MKRSVPAVFLLVLAVFIGLVLAQDGPESVVRGTKRFRKSVVASGLAGPWEIIWGPDDRLWVTERRGKRIIRINPSTGERNDLITIPEVFAPGSQDGILGMALHPDLLRGKGNDFVYAGYTYVDEKKGPTRWVTDPKNPYRFLYGKVVRFTYDAAKGSLGNPVELIRGLPAGNDHIAMRLRFGPDNKLYLSIGDQGNNQLGNFCRPIEAQRLPTADEIKGRDYASYVGKTLRLNLDGSIPQDNPRIGGVVSHVYTYGHRNPQGINFGPDGTLYESEHGPKTDDEVNILTAGSNYGWPNVAGLRDNKAYEYARWAEATTPCSQLRFSDLEIHPSVPREPESAFKQPFVEPIATMFTVPTGYNFEDPACKGINFICWPTIGVSGVEYYESKGTGIPGWDRVLLLTTLKRGSLYVLPLTPDGKHAAGPFHRYFQSQDRFRDSAVSPDGRTIYIATDTSGLVQSSEGGATTELSNPGAILAFTYEGEGGPEIPDAPNTISQTTKPPSSVATSATSNVATSATRNGMTSAMPSTAAGAGVPPQFTTAQAASGKTAYEANCAVCHGSTMTNGTFGTPLAGEYFRNKWFGHTVGELYEKAKTMPPNSPGSLSADTYADILAYVLEVNGFKAGDAKLPAGGEALRKMQIK